MIFNGTSLEDKFTITDIRGRGILVNDIETIEVAGKAGAYFISRKIPARVLEVDIVIASDSPMNMRKDIRELNAILSVDEPKKIIFSDDEEVSYYGIPADSQENGEVVATSEATIVFICADPFAYSDEKEHYFEFDVTTLVNEGSEESEPIFELEVIKPVTYALIQNNNEEYQMIGRPSDDEVEAVESKVTVLYENGSTIDDWQDASMDMIDDPNVSNIGGQLGSDGAGIRPNPYGPSGNGQRGGAKTRELPYGLKDFELETTFDIISRREIENWRMMIYLHDENLNSIGQIGLKDNSRNYKRRVPLGTAGPHSAGYGAGRVLGDRSEYNNNARDTTLFYLRMKREGRTFSFYVGEWKNFRHINVWDGIFEDVNGDYQGLLKYITLFIGSYQDRPIPSRLRMNSVEVFELIQAVEDRTPYIARAGDLIIFDHREKDLLINGESRKDIKDFGGQYFTLKKGENQLVLMPTDSFIASVRYRETHR